jgi:hypothetical protein
LSERGAGDHSGAEGELRLSMVHIFRNGLMVMLEVFSEHVDALRAAGLSEPSPQRGES